jgi:hypothetical protein
VVTQHEERARFYNSGSSVLLDDDKNGTTDVPVFNSTFARDEDSISFTSSTDEGDIDEQASGGQSFGSDGVYVPTQGSTLTGGIYVRGSGDINLSVDVNNNAVYTITQGSTTKKITVDHSNSTTTVEDIGSGSPTVYQGLPDGQDDVGTLIYVRGDVTNLGGTVQENTQLTIASQDDIIITDDVTYSQFTPATDAPGDPGYVPPSAVGATNLLGLVSWQGDVRVGTAAPDDVQVHGTIFASSGIFAVDEYDNAGTGPRGTATLLGGVISDNYGAFGQFSGATGQQIAGYGRNFVYDERMQTGQAPPYFPSLQTFIAFTNDIADKIVWQEGE